MLTSAPRAPFRQSGVSLIELMIALVAGLLVSGAAVALIVSVMKSNAETMKATRLTQELRTTTEIIAREMRRARSVDDPIANLGMPAASKVTDCNFITPKSTDTPPSASCTTFAYDCEKDASGTVTGTFKAIGVAGGKVRLATGTTSATAPACPTSATGTILSSNIITINSMTITAQNDNEYTISLAGKFSNDPSSSPLVRNFNQEVRIRSAVVQ
jgi:Tfp pilus assembly protein PilW